jgi:hypothetical protein
MTRAGVHVLGAVIMVLAACQPGKNERVVRRWLLCEECTSGELDSVVALGDEAAGPLIQALRGPPESGREHIRRQADERWRRLRSSLGTMTITQPDFVGHYEANYVAHYQSQAAIALGRVGTPVARAALFSAMRRDSVYRQDVLRSLASAAPLALVSVAGAAQAAPLDSFVRVEPTVLARDSVSGQPVPGLNVAFIVDSGGGRVSHSVRRTGPNGRASVRWKLGPGPDSINVLRAMAFRRSARLHATAHGLAPRLVFIVPPSNATRGQRMTPTARVAALDAWDQRDTTLHGTAAARVIGKAFGLTEPFVAGQADFPSFVPTFSGTGFRLMVQVTGATSVVSQPFDVAPQAPSAAIPF